MQFSKQNRSIFHTFAKKCTLEFRCEDRRGTGRTSQLQLGHCDVQRDKELQRNRYIDFRGQTVFLHAANKCSWRGDFMPQKGTLML